MPRDTVREPASFFRSALDQTEKTTLAQANLAILNTYFNISV